MEVKKCEPVTYPAAWCICVHACVSAVTCHFLNCHCIASPYVRQWQWVTGWLSGSLAHVSQVRHDTVDSVVLLLEMSNIFCTHLQGLTQSFDMETIQRTRGMPCSVKKYNILSKTFTRALLLVMVVNTRERFARAEPLQRLHSPGVWALDQTSMKASHDHNRSFTWVYPWRGRTPVIKASTSDSLSC